MVSERPRAPLTAYKLHALVRLMWSCAVRTYILTDDTTHTHICIYAKPPNDERANEVYSIGVIKN